MRLFLEVRTESPLCDFRDQDDRQTTCGQEIRFVILAIRMIANTLKALDRDLAGAQPQVTAMDLCDQGTIAPA